MLDVNEFDSMQIGLASPEKIREWSHGEVTKPETINYRTLKPERDGLFCERIFGPQKDWECHCGKYKRIRNKGVICDKCGVEVTRAKVRRERMAHIELATPVSHIWYFKGIPSRMGLILDISPKSLERVLYFVAYIVLDPKDTGLTKKQLLTEPEYQEAVATYGRDAFVAEIGAQAIKKLLQEIDLDALHAELRAELDGNSGQKRLRAIRRLEVVEAFRKSGNRPEWMILDCIPVIPPELRPMVQLDGGRFATSDLNDLYRRVINRNNRLKRLMELHAPDIIVRNEKRMLQEAVDALIDNGRRGRAVTGAGSRPLKSLSDLLKGKQGRFRQNLLGKRVDYSGRSVIVVGPELKMHQCGLPKEMALELFKPFVMKELVKRGLTTNIKSAKKKVEKVVPEVWDVLEDVIHEHPILLNRAPTLHRLGIQAFEPILWEGRAIKLHPLVCAAYNADFDGDQMACHLPLSVEAQSEARTLMLSVNNILSTKDGKPVAVPSQDMVLGAYYLTIDRSEEYPAEKRKVTEFTYSLYDDAAKATGVPIPTFADSDEVRMAYDQHEVRLQEYIFLPVPTEDIPTQLLTDAEREKHSVLVLTTPGRMIFNAELPKELRKFRRVDHAGVSLLETGMLMDKKQLAKLINECFRTFGMAETAELLDKVKKLGFYYARKAGMTIGIDDIRVPEDKKAILEEADKTVEKIHTMFRRGLITEEERYRNTIKVWDDATTKVTKAMMKGMDKFNPLTMMAQSGARGNEQQIRQLAGMRGLMADPTGRIIDLPIKANFREGLTVLDYFTSSHGARKGLADTALRTADSGYLTRRLVDVSQDVIVREQDCDIVTIDFVRERGRFATSSKAAVKVLRDKLIGRILDAPVIDPKTGEILLPAGQLIAEADLDIIGAHLVPEIVLRGYYSNTAEHAHVSNEKTVVSLGEPEEQLRNRLREEMMNRMRDKEIVDDVVDESGQVLFKAGEKLSDTTIESILASDVKVVRVRLDEVVGVEVEAIREGDGIIEPLRDRIAGRTAAQDFVDDKGRLIVAKNELIVEEAAAEIEKFYDKAQIRSPLTCHSPHGICMKCYGRNLGTGWQVEVGEAVGIIAAQSIGEPGTQLTMRTFHTGGVASNEDITQGLPRVEELFEARKPKRNAIISEIGGTVQIEEVEGNEQVFKINVTDGADVWSKTIPFGLKIVVADGETIEKGARLTEGSINPHDILRVLGVNATQRYIVYEVQKVYKSQGVEINDKHIEVIVRQMLHKVKIDDPGDADFLPGERVESGLLERENRRLTAEEKRPATGTHELLGITKAALATESFLSAASFQETTRVLTDAAIKGKIDPLLGLKENVIIGKLIPAGTGMARYRKVSLLHDEPTEGLIPADDAPADGEPIPQPVEEPSNATEPTDRKKQDGLRKADGGGLVKDDGEGLMQDDVVDSGVSDDDSKSGGVVKDDAPATDGAADVSTGVIKDDK